MSVLCSICRRNVVVLVGETVTLSVPVGTTVTVDDTQHVLEDGSLELAADMPAEYSLVFRLWPYLDATVEVVVNEA